LSLASIYYIRLGQFLVFGFGFRLLGEVEESLVSEEEVSGGKQDEGKAAGGDPGGDG